MKTTFLSFLLLVVHFSLNADYAESWNDGDGAVASVYPLATQAGLDAFKKGGNAIDAALAVAFTLGVVDGHNSGIGGGCFILAHSSDGEIIAIDGREMAPSKAHRNMYIENGEVIKHLSKTGPLAIGIPGSVAALYELQKDYGTLQWSDVILPAGKLAEDGFPIDHNYARKSNHTIEALNQYTATKSIFTKNGNALPQGFKLIQSDLAHTYKQLAEKGPDYFYKGAFSKQAANWLQKNGGIITEQDFSNYKTVRRSPIRSTYKNYEIIGFPPPGSGGIHIAQMLNIMENFPYGELSEADQRHILIETMKLAFADRAHWLGDSDFVNVPKGLMSKAYANSLSSKLSLKHSSPINSHGMPPEAKTDVFGKHTTHIATADKKGNWVAITTTLNTSFGSKVTIPGTGVLMNNQMDDFSAAPGTANYFGLVGNEANSIQAGKRPLSSMSPTIVLKDGVPCLTLGAAGGPTIITQVFQTILNTIDLQLPIEDAVARPRVHQQWKPDYTLIETSISSEIRKSLEKRGHVFKEWKNGGATQAIAMEEGKLKAVTDPRVKTTKD